MFLYQSSEMFNPIFCSEQSTEFIGLTITFFFIKFDVVIITSYTQELFRYSNKTMGRWLFIDKKNPQMLSSGRGLTFRLIFIEYVLDCF